MKRLFADQRKLVQWLRTGRDVDIAVAFWGKGAVDAVGLDDPSRNVRIVLNLESGGTNPSVVEALLKTYPGRIRHDSRLHAKCMISKTHGAMVIGSANISANGLGLEGAEQTSWREMALVTNDEETVKEGQAWFEGIWGNSREVDDEALAKAHKEWLERRIHRPQPPNGHLALRSDNLFQAALRGDERLTDRNIWVIFVREDLSQKGADELKRLEAEAHKPLYAYENWRTMPASAKLVAFTEDKSGNIIRDGLYQTPEYPSKQGIILVQKLTDVLGLKPGPHKFWKKALLKAKESDPTAWNKEVFEMDLAKFVKTYGGDVAVGG